MSANDPTPVVPLTTTTIVEARPVAPLPTPESPHPPLPATTTFQEDQTTSGQRRINLIWEFTQAAIAIIFVLANTIVGVAQGLSLVPASQGIPPLLSNALFLIVGFYFSRTNHAAIGGIGPKPTDNYTGR